MTKTQKRANASKRSKQKRMATALRKFLKTANPAASGVASVRKNKTGYTIIVGK